MSGGTISTVVPGSVAAAIGLRTGDVLLEINGHPLRDVLDVQFYAADEVLDLVVRRGDREVVYEVERDYGQPLGLDFAAPTFDGMYRCRNHCEFCFVQQMPPGYRRSLYIKDDDYRYSVLYGSYITLTNLTEGDWARLEEQRLSPLYVSVHATDPDLRRELLGQEDVPDILEQIDRLADLGITVHAQIVLVPGLNDGRQLLRTVSELAMRYPAIQSIGVVPVGLTRYHRGQCERYTPDGARATLDLLGPMQRAYRQQHNRTLLYLADEWYLLADQPVPPDEAYDDYPQLENGIGLVRQFLDDYAALDVRPGRDRSGRYTLACGTLIAPLLCRIASELREQGGVEIEVVPVLNRSFGETVTVSGLLTGADVRTALEERALGQTVFLPRAMFAMYTPDLEDGDALRTLDDQRPADLASALSRPVVLASYMSEVWAAIREGQ
jgi:putative radical SAM enzyme (TIGR03279 family)